MMYVICPVCSTERKYYPNDGGCSVSKRRIKCVNCKKKFLAKSNIKRL